MKRRHHESHAPWSCPCVICPGGCITRDLDTAATRLGWHKFYCRVCGSRWTSWHWLCLHTPFSWRRYQVISPGPTLTLDQVATLLIMRRFYETNEANHG